METQQPTLFDLPSVDAGEVEHRPPDWQAREAAVDPANDVVLEASAGTGKTRVLVERYLRLMQSGVDPRHVLAMTFTRKAAAEMRDRVIAELRRRAADGTLSVALWNRLRERLVDIEISTIDAFCFGLLREFPLEADVDPAFEIADETEMARLVDEAIESTLRAVRPLFVDDEAVRLLFARVRLPSLRRALAQLVDRREIALPAVAAFVKRHARVSSAAEASRRFAERLRAALDATGTRQTLFDDGPHGSPEFGRLHADLLALDEWPDNEPVRAQQLRRRLETHFLTRQGAPRQRLARALTPDLFGSPAARARHEAAVRQVAPLLADAISALDADVDGILARGVHRVLTIAVGKYERLLHDHALLDFAGMLSRAVRLLENQEEFARSRLKLQARYHHLLIDEFQDTSRLQWRLVSLLIDAWGEGEGAADAPTSIFVVGDRKQSIYRFRHAEVTLLDEAARRIGALRPARAVHTTISASYRAVPELLAFVNSLSEEIQSPEDLPERFRYTSTDRFPVSEVGPGGRRDGQPVLGIVAEPTMHECASAVALEIERLLATATVRDRHGPPRRARPDDIAILFRARTGHQHFEEAIEARGIRTYVYKGLGFFDAPEVQDLQALIGYLARPDSDRRAAEWLRSRALRISDAGLVQLAPSFARALADPAFDPATVALDDRDRALLVEARRATGRWLALADRVPPAELVDLVLRESVYAFELRGRRWDQARENVKKVRSVVRRVGNRGYATLERLAAYFATLRTGEESNAVIEAADAVNLMTIHAAKGLEFPIVFVVNLHLPGRGRGGGFSVIQHGPDGEPVVAFGSSTATALEERRELEELRRLLYVAVTRARDRLYLAAETHDGVLRRGHRSLASLLPASLAQLFDRAGSGDEIRWEPVTGSFDFRVCRSPDAGSGLDPAKVSASATAVDPQPPQLHARRAFRSGDPMIVNVTDVDRAELHLRATYCNSDAELQVGATYEGSDRLLGTVVHRLFQRAIDPALDEQAIARVVSTLVRPAEMVDIEDREAFAVTAAMMFKRLRSRDDIAALLAVGECLYEVPFTFASPERPDVRVRGIIDCVVLTPGGATIVEFKTGVPRSEHRDQVAFYAEALRTVLGIGSIDLKIVYA